MLMLEMLKLYREQRSEFFLLLIPLCTVQCPTRAIKLTLFSFSSRVVIISTVRSRSRFLPLDQARSKGLVHEPRRFNVAMTRAKELLIVVGNPEILNVSSLFSFSVSSNFSLTWKKKSYI